MNSETHKIGIITHDYTGKQSELFIPVFDFYPQDLDLIGKYQNCYTDYVRANIITLFRIDNQGNKTYMELDITRASMRNSPIVFYVVEAENVSELFVYCDYRHNGKFRLSQDFVEKSHLSNP